MFLERDAEFLGTPQQLVAGDLSGEAFVLHLLDDGVRVHLVEAPVRTHVGHGDDEAGQLVAGVDGSRQEARPRDAGVVAVTEHGLDHDLRVAETAQLLGAAQRMGLGVALVVEVVEQAGDPPCLEL